MANFIYSASDFLYLITENYSFGKNSTVAALDLRSCIPVNPICKDKHYPFSNYSDPNVHLITTPPPNYEYSGFLSRCMERFRKEFKSSLLRNLDGISNCLSKRQLDDICDNYFIDERYLFSCLLKNEPSKRNRTILTQYLTARCHDWWPMLEVDRYSIFEFGSNLLYKWSCDSSLLCFLLLRVMKINNPLPECLICDTNSPEKLSFIIQHAHTYCNEIMCPDLFRLFKYTNSILGCLRNGRTDILEILLSYGNWKSHFKREEDPEATINLHITFPAHPSGMYEFMPRLNYHLYRRKHIYYIYETFCADIELREQCLSAMKLFWKSIPYPFIQPDEIYNEFITIDTLPAERDHVIEIIDLYNSCLGPIKLHSRSLKHLARCAIRSFFDEKSLLPGGIDNFENILPKIIINYLKLKE